MEDLKDIPGFPNYQVVMGGLMIGKDEIVITKKEYDQLVADSEFLQNLRAAGVDNWEGYYYGYSGYDEDED